MAIQVRRGNEADFDPSKLLPGEWAVSTDTRYVRMCFAPGIVLRMATYESFEADMAKVREILSTCQSIEQVVTRLASEVNANTEIVVENTELSKQYMEQAKIYAENASAVSGVEIATQDRAGLVKGGENHIAEDGTLELTRKTTDTTLPNSYVGGLRMRLKGNTQQDSTTGHQLFDATQLKYWTSSNFKVSDDGYTIVVSGKAVYANSGCELDCSIFAGKTVYLKADRVESVQDIQTGVSIGVTTASGTIYYDIYVKGNTIRAVDIPDDVTKMTIHIYANNSSSAISTDNTTTVKGLMLSFSDVDWEPYTGGIPSPSPLYPQSIKSAVVREVKVHGKNQLDCRGLIEKTSYGVTYTPVKDSKGNLLYVEVKGTATQNSSYALADTPIFDEPAILSGCPSGGSGSTYFMEYSNYTDKSYADYGNSATISENFDFSQYPNSRVRIVVKSGQTMSHKFYPMLRKADVSDATYEPYQENTITLSDPIELQEWDVISEGKLSNGSVEILINSLDKIINVTELTTVVRFVYSVEKKGSSANDLFCDKLQYKVDYTGDYEHCYRAGSGTQILFYINKERFATLDNTGYLEYLSANPLTMLYELSEPVVTDIPTEDKVALDSLKTYDGVSYVSIISDIQPDSEFEYGTSRIGGYTLDALNTAKRNEAQIASLVALTNDISARMVESEE